MAPLDYKDSDQKNKKSPPRNTVRVERYFNNRFITIGQTVPAAQLRWSISFPTLVKSSTSLSRNQQLTDPPTVVMVQKKKQHVVRLMILPTKNHRPFWSPRISGPFLLQFGDFLFPKKWRKLSYRKRFKNLLHHLNPRVPTSHPSPRDWIATIISTALPKVAFNKPVTLRFWYIGTPGMWMGMKWPHQSGCHDHLWEALFWKQKLTHRDPCINGKST